MIIRLGSRGEYVVIIQKRLKKLNYYRGPNDGIYGGHTELSVKSFQKALNLTADGIVGSITWKALFNKKLTNPKKIKHSLDYKCLALTGSIETGYFIPDCFAGLSGNFDNQGMSFGALQWNFGQESLQPLLKEFNSKYPDLIKSIFGDKLQSLLNILDMPNYKGIEFAINIQHPIKHFILEPWRGMFKALGRCDEFQQIEVDYAKNIFDRALRMSKEYTLRSERSIALMFDICVQNGSIQNTLKPKILADYALLKDIKNANALEVSKMGIIIDRRLEKVSPRWREDVRARKYTIANGQGFIHGIQYDLASQFDINLVPF